MFTYRCPAKINWFLNILHQRGDGYHEISSLMQCITLCDTVTLEPSEGLEVITEAQIALEDNLVYKAAKLLKETSGRGGARITLKKDIPMAAGLGGGSSDAAYTLTGLNRLWGLGLARHELIELGKAVGSDVPFFFGEPAALISGRGEIVSPVRLNKTYTLALVKPQVNVSSAWAYAQADTSPKKLTKKGNNDDNIKLFCHALETGDFASLSSAHGNDLEPVVAREYPVIEKIKHDLTEKGSVFSAMSGSGSTVFGVFESYEKAHKAIEGMASENWRRVVKTVISD